MRWEIYKADGMGGTWLATFDRRTEAKAALTRLSKVTGRVAQMKHSIRNFVFQHLSDPAFLGTLLEDLDREYHRAAQDETRRPLDRARLLAQAEAIHHFRSHYQTQTDNER